MSVSTDGHCLQTALRRLGFEDAERMGLYELLAGILLLGDVRFGERTGLDISFVETHKGLLWLLEAGTGVVRPARTDTSFPLPLHHFCFKKQQKKVPIREGTRGRDGGVTGKRLQRWTPSPMCSKCGPRDSWTPSLSPPFGSATT